MQPSVISSQPSAKGVLHRLVDPELLTFNG